MTQIKQFWKNTHDVKPQEGRDLLIVRKRERPYYQFGLYNSGNDRVMITSPTGFPWQNFEDFDMWAYLDDLLSISEEPANEQTLANSAKSCKDLQEYIDDCWQTWVSSDNNPIANGDLTKEEFEFYARHFAQWGVEYVNKSDISQPVSETCKGNGDSLTDEDLEKAANDFNESDPPLYGNRYYWDSEPLFGEQLKTTFKAGAQWQKEQDKFKSGKERVKGYRDGFKDCKEQMMNCLKIGHVSAVMRFTKNSPDGIIEIQAEDSKITSKVGDEIKIIILPSDNK